MQIGMSDQLSNMSNATLFRRLSHTHTHTYIDARL